jgi:maleylpyruvate isomerase
MILYGFSYSGSAYRARIALNLKGIPYEQRSVHLLRDGGEQHQAAYQRLSPLGVVPTLVDGELVVTQSGAILDYLDEAYPTPPLLPDTVTARARVRAIAQTFGVDSHPLVTIRVLQHLHMTHGIDAQSQLEWSRHWLTFGLGGGEALLDGDPATGRFCHGDQPTLADIYLVPQVLAARRHDIDLSAFPVIARINDACMDHPAFAAADPEQQPDALDADEWRHHLAPDS